MCAPLVQRVEWREMDETWIDIQFHETLLVQYSTAMCMKTPFVASHTGPIDSHTYDSHTK